MIEQGLSTRDDASYLAPGDFVSFVFNGERFIAYLWEHELGLRSSESTWSGYPPFIVTRTGIVAYGVSCLRKLHRDEITEVLAAVMLQPGNEDLVLDVERVCRG